MSSQWSPLEGPLIEIEEQIAELERLTERRGIDKSAQIAVLKRRHAELTERIFAELSAWDKTIMADTPSGPTRSTTSRSSSASSSNSTATAASATTPPSSPAWRGSTDAPSPSSVTRRGATSRSASSATSAALGPRATARPSAS
jgi:hypothetical protein